MNKQLIILFSLAMPFFMQAQRGGVIVSGSEIYIQKGALVHVDGDFVNDASQIKNDGIIELKGDFETKDSGTLSVYNDNSSKDRAVKFIGSGPQAIKGNVNTAGTSSFYNLVIDKANATDTVTMDAAVTVEGSLIFGTGTTGTYQPTDAYTANNQKGLLNTYDANGEYTLNITNGNTDAIAGYPAMAINGAPTTGFILTKGDRGTAEGGVSRMVAGATAYEYPIGTVENGYNAVRMNFNNIPAGGGMVKGKFNDGTDNAGGYVGSLSQQCIGCTADNPTPNNNGYNRYFATNPCNNNSAQWFIMNDAITQHGYWSFAGDGANDAKYSYVIETFPNSFNAQGDVNSEAMRTLKYTDSYGANPSTAGTNWTGQIDSVSTANDLLEYSRNTGDCYQGTGVPGGEYTGFGHFAMRMSSSGGALPVQLVYVKATPTQNNTINVSWQTALEINNSGFEVKRSTDGINFTTVGWVAGHNNSTVTNNYNYEDNTVTAGVVYYYQLNQVDNDGKATASNIVSADLDGNADVAAVSVSEPMPNPARDYTHFNITSSVNTDISVKVYDMTGRLVTANNNTVSAGNSNITLSVEELTTGQYTAVIEANGKNYAKKLVVSKN